MRRPKDLLIKYGRGEGSSEITESCVGVRVGCWNEGQSDSFVSVSLLFRVFKDGGIEKWMDLDTHMRWERG